MILTEYMGGDQGNVYDYIRNMKLNLTLGVPREFTKMVFNFIIQLTMALEHAHNNGLVHNDLSLSKILFRKDAAGNITYVLTGFKPGGMKNFPSTMDDERFVGGFHNMLRVQKVRNYC